MSERARVRIDELGLELTVRRLHEPAGQPVEERAGDERMEVISRFAGGIAHELNNLLTAIAGYNELILSRMSESNPLRRDAAEIERAVDRAGELARQLLAIAGRHVDPVTTLDVNAILSRLEPRLRRLTGRVELAVELAPGVPPVRASAEQLEEIVVLLVRASLSALGGTGRITVTSGAVPGEPAATLAVRDTGPPIETGAIGHVFEPFAGEIAGRGAGLELAAAYGLVAQNGGQLQAANADGGGVVFTVTLTAGGEKPAPGPARGGTSRETILLAEDEEVVREIVRETLERHGYVVITARDGRQAIELASAGEPIDLLLSDVTMPGMSGVELADRLRGTTPGLRVVYMSGSPELEVMRDMEVNGGTGFLQKPATPSAILACVRAALDAG